MFPPDNVLHRIEEIHIDNFRLNHNHRPDYFHYILDIHSDNFDKAYNGRTRNSFDNLYCYSRDIFYLDFLCSNTRSICRGIFDNMDRYTRCNNCFCNKGNYSCSMGSMI